jgi:hypothetical protein
MEVLHKNNSGPYALAQDSDHVYWMDSFELLSASKTTKDAKVIGQSRSSTDWSLLESGGYIYKIDRGGITRLPVKGGPEEVVYDQKSGRKTPEAGGYTEDPYFADVMTVNPAGAVMWLTTQASGGLLQARLDNTGTIKTLASGEATSNFGRMIADNRNVYWIEPQTGTLKAVSLQGGKVTPISTKCDDRNHLAQDDENIYFKTPDGLVQASKNGFKTSTLGKLPPTISALAVDGSYVYFATWSQRSAATGSIQRMPRVGGTSEVVARGLKTPNSLAIDNDYVYFADDEDKTVARIPRRSAAGK